VARGDPRPDYMIQCRVPEVPWWIAQFENIWFAWAVALILPTLVALIFGGLVFYRRIKGVYFSLITQALLLAVFEFIRNQRPYTGGVRMIISRGDLGFDLSTAGRRLLTSASYPRARARRSC